MSDVAVGTVVAKPYLAFARVLAQSFREQHPHIPFFVVLADAVDGYFDPDAEPFELLRLEDLIIPHLPRFRFHYPQQPLSYAVTPYLLAYLLERGFRRLVYFKQESRVLKPLDSLLERLNQHSIVLTPHLLTPLTSADRATREGGVLQSGIYNIGLLGVSDTPTGRQFLDWWQDRLYDHCRHDVTQAMHHEQRWIDLTPGYFEDVHILRDPSYNIGHWNLPEREVHLQDGKVWVDGRPARYFRFSGFSPDQPLAITRHARRLNMANVGPASAVFYRFMTLLEDAGYHTTKTWPYAYGRFDNDVIIPDIVRQVYLDLGDAVGQFGDPFCTAPAHSFFRWLNQPVDDHPDPTQRVSQLWHAIYRRRQDVQSAFPDLLGVHRADFLTWVAEHGAPEMGVPVDLVIL